MRKSFTDRCRGTGVRWTKQRSLIADILAEASDHPDVRELHRRVKQRSVRMTADTIYRTVKLLEGAGILESQAFRDRRKHYEQARDKHHDHLLDLDTGKILEFRSAKIERVQRELAERLGYRVISYRLQLFGRLLPQSETPGSSFGRPRVRRRRS